MIVSKPQNNLFFLGCVRQGWRWQHRRPSGFAPSPEVRSASCKKSSYEFGPQDLGIAEWAWL